MNDKRFLPSIERIANIMSSYSDFEGLLKQAFHVMESELGLENPKISILGFTKSLRPTKEKRDKYESGTPRHDIIPLDDKALIITPIKMEGREIGFLSALSENPSKEQVHTISVIGELLGFAFFLLGKRKTEVKKAGKIIFSSPKMEEVVRMAIKVAPSDVTVLITGESGVGKELIAELIHERSERKDKPLIKINCAAIPDPLLESELFGYKKGAFTGAITDKRGKFELADGGTIFLDEIGDMSLHLQAKILRTIQSKEIEPIGGTPKKVDVRIIAATNKNLENEVREGRFREDLLYRLNVVPIHVPSLRERKEDIQPLVEHFLDLFNKKHGKNISISKEAMRIMENYSWPGNVRELENIIERLVIMSYDLVITPEDIPDEIKRDRRLKQDEASEEQESMKKVEGVKEFEMTGGLIKQFETSGAVPLQDIIEKIEIEVIQEVLRRTKNISDAARKLGLTRRQLEWRIKKYRTKLLT